MSNQSDEWMAADIRGNLASRSLQSKLIPQDVGEYIDVGV